MLLLSDCRYCPCCLVILPLTSYNLTKDPPHDHDILHTTFRNRLIVRGNHIPGGATHWPIVRNASGLTSPCGYLRLCLVLTASLVCRLLVCGKLLYAVLKLLCDTTSHQFQLRVSGGRQWYTQTHTYTTRWVSAQTLSESIRTWWQRQWCSQSTCSYTFLSAHDMTLHFISFHYITLHYITLHYVTLRYVTLRCVTLCYVTLCYVTLHYAMFRYVAWNIFPYRGV